MKRNQHIKQIHRVDIHYFIISVRWFTLWTRKGYRKLIPYMHLEHITPTVRVWDLVLGTLLSVWLLQVVVLYGPLLFSHVVFCCGDIRYSMGWLCSKIVALRKPMKRYPESTTIKGHIPHPAPKGREIKCEPPNMDTKADSHSTTSSSLFP